jgi:hypothetical protein
VRVHFFRLITQLGVDDFFLPIRAIVYTLFQPILGVHVLGQFLLRSLNTFVLLTCLMISNCASRIQLCSLGSPTVKENEAYNEGVYICLTFLVRVPGLVEVPPDPQRLYIFDNSDHCM